MSDTAKASSVTRAADAASAEPVASAVETLAPCPFCGKSEFVRLKDFEGDCSNCGFGAWGRVVICDAAGIRGTRGCGASTGYCETDAEATEVWNRRAAAPPPQAPGWAEGTRDALQAFSDWFAERNVEATGDWRAAAEDAQHQIDDLLALLPAPPTSAPTGEPTE